MSDSTTANMAKVTVSWHYTTFTYQNRPYLLCACPKCKFTLGKGAIDLETFDVKNLKSVDKSAAHITGPLINEVHAQYTFQNFEELLLKSLARNGRAVPQAYLKTQLRHIQNGFEQIWILCPEGSPRQIVDMHGSRWLNCLAFPDAIARNPDEVVAFAKCVHEHRPGTPIYLIPSDLCLRTALDYALDRLHKDIATKNPSESLRSTTCSRSYYGTKFISPAVYKALGMDFSAAELGVFSSMLYHRRQHSVFCTDDKDGAHEKGTAGRSKLDVCIFPMHRSAK